MRLRAVDTPLVREEQDPVVRRGHEEVLDDVFLPELRALHSLAAALLRPVKVGLGALRVAATCDRDDDVLFGDEVLEAHVALIGDEPAAPVVAVLRRDLAELLADDRALPLGAREDR